MCYKVIIKFNVVKKFPAQVVNILLSCRYKDVVDVRLVIVM